MRKYDPDEVQAPREVQSLTEGSSDDSNDGDVQVAPLQGWDRLNLIKRFKKRKELKLAKEAKVSSHVICNVRSSELAVQWPILHVARLQLCGCLLVIESGT